MKAFRIEPEVYEDLADAADWYDSKEPGLGDRFLDFAQSLIRTVAERPDSFPSVGGQVRVAHAKPFPYKVYFHATNDSVKVFAVLHGARRPGSWRARLR